MKVSQDGGDQYAQYTWETVLGFRSKAGDVKGGHKGGAALEEQEDLCQVVSTPLAE
ncbi:hypothetical protein DPMN_165798 [Dreissena polymorpha]|uniref:Uncharacterized protein n=1 Tax=Dreissena polymorpha TaxID=45954 RepID=A0A9D4ITL0_DREPO|nr:hypothetical protein DPMN_165798 [Dreissena polymorpha]